MWNSQGLRIDAANSSLQQILKDVSTAIGVKYHGLNADQRVFGTYGPGPARDVLSQLLDGSGYNVLMIGDHGQGTPRQVVLTRQPTGPAPPAGKQLKLKQRRQQCRCWMNLRSRNRHRSSPAPNLPPGFGPGAQPRTPQQILQEMQQRQQQIEQQQQQATARKPTAVGP